MLTILVEYLAAARKTGPRGAGAGLGGQPPYVTGGYGRRGRRACVRARWLHRAAGGLAGAARLLPRLACWRGRASWHGRTRPRRTACTAAGMRGRGGQAALLRCSGNGDCSGTRAAAEDIPGSAAPWIRARHCRAKISGAAEPCHFSGQRFWSSPRQLPATPPCMARHRHLAAPGQ